MTGWGEFSWRKCVKKVVTTVIALYCYAQGQCLASSPASPGWNTCVSQGQGLGDSRALPYGGTVGLLLQNCADKVCTSGLPGR